ncbi:sugar O-acetyltransferase [Pseudofrankia sp. BMG5.36]|uniref:sugar O-acetyltransferase n=1 Tax=Pseudofrankia sp. BMG5.36 TaxID=1834512 RepID=UPI0008DA1CEB|nr:sugar O-acetyltransferase [Pseudofrankia sp. BMG5.36]OHV45555.1 maltose acetyltransferase [Pseudofrankia sp. BMG5.36]
MPEQTAAVRAVSEQKRRMLAGELYHAGDEELATDRLRAARLRERYNATRADEPELRAEILGELLGAVGDRVEILPPLHVDYGYQTTIGPGTFVNTGAVLLDVARISLGADVQIGPGVQLLTPTHPLDPALRRTGREAGEPIMIGDDVWLGGGVIVCPGVPIGENSVVGAGAVVTRDLPANVLAVGNPARVIRTL